MNVCSLFIKDWDQVKHYIVISKKAPMSLQRKVLMFKIDQLDQSVAKKAKRILRKYREDEVKKASSGAVVFYVWVSYKEWINTNILYILFYPLIIIYW